MVLSVKKMDWPGFIGHTVNITMNESYGVVYCSEKEKQPAFCEIVFKTGKLVETFDEGLVTDKAAEGQILRIYVPLSSIKCVDIF